MTASYLLKIAVPGPGAAEFRFARVGCMYGGTRIAAGDRVYLFDSETSGGPGLIALCRVAAASAVPRLAGVARQTPLVDLQLRREATARRACGRAVLKPFRDWADGRPETELNFKFYRQATDKLGGISAAAAAFLDGCFQGP